MIILIKAKARLIKPIQPLLTVSLLVFLFSGLNCFAEETMTPIPIDTSISLDQATAKIIKNDDNIRILGAETEIIDDKEIHIIKFLTLDGRIQHYKIDAKTGEIIN